MRNKIIAVVCGLVLIIGGFVLGYYRTNSLETQKYNVLAASLCNVEPLGGRLPWFMGTKDKDVDITFDSKDNPTIKFVTTKYKGEPINITINLEKVPTPSGLGYKLNKVTAVKSDGTELSESDKECYIDFSNHVKDLGGFNEGAVYLIK